MKKTMDRRQIKTRAAIFQAMCRLMEKKNFSKITVQEIIDEANVGRSTFYAHFETKEMLLKELCADIFEHIFSTGLSSEPSHDFSKAEQSLEEQITHLLYHLRDNKGDIIGILSGDSCEVFMVYFVEYLKGMMLGYPAYLKDGVSKEFAVNHLVGSFAEAVKWWVKSGTKESPETIAKCYIKMIE